MPLYEYECDACGHRFEQIQKFSDPHVDKCPVCGATRVRKLLSSPAIQFKGSGWYITDYARKEQPAAKGEKADASEKTGAADAKTDAKTEAKTESKSETKAEAKSDKSTPSSGSKSA